MPRIRTQRASRHGAAALSAAPFPRAGRGWAVAEAADGTDLIIVSDLEARPMYVSPASRDLLGYQPRQLLHVPGLSLVHEDDLTTAAQALAQVGQGKVVSIDRLRVAHAAGYFVPLEIVGVPLFGVSGEVRSILAILRRPPEIPTDGGNGEVYRDIFERVPVGLFRSTPDGRILAANETLVHLLGYEDRDALMQMPTLDSWADPRMREDLVRRLDRHGEVRNLDAQWRRQDGSTFWGRLNARVVRGPDGTPLHFEGHIEDVTDLKRTERALRDSEFRYRQLVEEIPAVLYLAEPGTRGQWLYVGPRIADLLSYSQEEWLADPGLWERCVHPADAGWVIEAEEALWSSIESGTRSLDQPFHMEYRMVSRDGREVYVRDEATVVPRPGGSPLLRGMLIDITVQKRAEQALDVATKRATSVIESSLDGIVVMDHRGSVLEFNPAAEAIFGYRRADLVGRPMAEYLIPEELRERHRKGFQRYLRTREGRVMDRRLELQAMRHDGTAFSAELTITAVQDSEPPLFIAFVRDITERKRSDALLEKRARELERSYEAVETLARTDHLTGLANRQALMEHLDQVLGPDGDARVAVVLLNLDRFKGLNETLGHDGADAVLVEVGRRLRGVADEGDMVARLGGDEFVLVRNGVTDEPAAGELAGRVSAVLSGPVGLDDGSVEVSAGLGIALSSPSSRKATELLRNADAALLEAKQRGLGKWAVFDRGASPRSGEHEALLASLRSARMEEFELHYQPVVDLDSERVSGFEALVRWQHPTRGLLLPGQFLELAEDTGLILQIGDHVLARACRDALELLEPLDPGATVAVNLSARQLAEPNLADQLLAHLRRSGLEPHRLAVEITETASVQNADVAVETLRRLRAAGVRVAVDDFGIGYSSLLYLRRFPIDLVKIDRAFIQGMDEHEEDTAIVSAVTNMARSLGLVPVAEGVETAVQRDAVRGAGCELAQGFLWGRPLPLDEALALLRGS